MSIANLIQWHSRPAASIPRRCVLLRRRLYAIPAREHAFGRGHARSGFMFVGEKGVQISAYYGGNPWMPFGREPAPGAKVRGLPGGWLLPESRFKDFKQPEPYLPRCERPDHYPEWCASAKPARSPSRPSNSPAG